MTAFVITTPLFVATVTLSMAGCIFSTTGFIFELAVARWGARDSDAVVDNEVIEVRKLVVWVLTASTPVA